MYYKANKIITGIIISLVFLFFACNQDTSKQNNAKTPVLRKEIAEHISVEKAKQLIDKYQNDDSFIILDIRSENEFTSGIIPKAIPVVFNDPDFRKKLASYPKENVYLLYCHSGGRSAMAMSIMKEMGFKEVYNMKGGVVQWKQLGYPLISPTE